MLPQPWRAAYTVLATLAVAPFSHGQGPGPLARRPSFDPLLHEAHSWVRFGSVDGLPDAAVRQVTETPDEVVWAVTDSGVVRFDGYRWTPVDGLPAGPGAELALDPEHDLAVLVKRRVFRGGVAGFAEVSMPAGSIPVAITGSAALGPAIILYNAAGEPSLRSLRDGSSQPLPARRWVPRANGDLTPAGAEIGVAIDSVTYRTEDGELQPVWRGPPGAHIKRLTFDESGRSGLAYIGFPPEQRGLWSLKADGGVEPVVIQPNLFVVSMDISPLGDAVVVLQSGDVLMRRGEEWRFLDPVPREMRRVCEVRFRENGDLWVATESGLYLYRPTHPSIEFWSHGPNVPHVVALEYVQASDGSTWVGLQDGVEQRRADGSVRSWRKACGFDLLAITAMAEDAAGHVWIGSGGGSLPGALRWDGTEWRFFGHADGLAADAVHKIRRDARGQLWFLGLGIDVYPSRGSNPGCFVFGGSSFERWDKELGLIHNRVYSFAEGPEGVLWFATYGGVSRWRDGRFEHWTQDRGLRVDRVYTLDVDSAGNAWFGHEGFEGLGVIEAGGAVRYPSLPEAGARGKVIDVRVDHLDRVWAGTSTGLLHFDGEVWSVGRAEDGIRSHRVHALLPVEGGALVATPNGGTVVLSEERQHPFRLDAEKVRLEQRGASMRWKVSTYWRNYDPASVRTRYRLDGGSWSDWSTQREVAFEGLAYGDHSIDVQARAFLGPLDGPTLTRDFSIARPLHLHPFFVAPLASTLLLLAGSSVHALHRRGRERKRRQESEAMFRQLTDNIREVFWVRDAVTHEVLYLSPGFVEVWDRERSDVLGWPSGWDRFIHYRDRARVRASYARDALHGTYDEEYRIVRGDGTVGWIRDRAFPVRDRNGRAYRIAGTSDDITQQKRAVSAIEESQARYQSLVETVPDALFLHQGGNITYANPAAVRLLGASFMEELVGLPVLEFVHPDDREGMRQWSETIQATAAPAGLLQVRFERLQGSEIAAEVVGDHVVIDGQPAVQLIARDVRERRRHEERQALLMRELDHRVKNNLAGVIAIAQQSMQGADTFEEFEQSFVGRVRAMAHMHEALATAGWKGLSLGEILRALMHPHVVKVTRVSLEGPALTVRARSVTSLSMALYELVMNATKYGALSNARGRLRLVWSMEGEMLCLTWTESDGPALQPPTGVGMGLSLVRGMIEYELGGGIEFDFRPTGLACVLRLPADTLLEPECATSARAATGAESHGVPGAGT